MPLSKRFEAARASRAKTTVLALVVMGLAPPGAAACNGERQAECDRFLAAMKPLTDGVPSPEAVEQVKRDVDAIKFADQPLGVYAKNYGSTLTVLSSTLKLKASGAAPDGTDDVIKSSLKEARTDTADTARYCSR